MKSQRAAFWSLVFAVAFVVTMTGCGKTPFDPQVQVAPANGLSQAKAIESLSTQRPISTFLAAQGTTSLFFPPSPDCIGWANNNPQTRFALVDYTGLIAQYLQANGGPVIGTAVTGTVSERPLADGRAEVTVVLHAKDALSWAVGLPGDLNGPLQFGYRAADLLADPTLRPALSSVNMKVVFTNDAPGAPLPDLVDAFILGNASPAQTLLSLNFRADGVGPLHAPSGWAEGAAGKLTISQTGILSNGFHGAVGDGFPVEIVNLQAVGKGVFMH